MRIPRSRVIAAGWVALVAAGCATTMDKNSGGDNVRGKAKVLKLNEPADDSLSADEGDNTDWKKVVVPAKMKLGVNLYWDDPAIRAVVHVRDQFGREFGGELKHDPGERENHWEVLVPKGDCFLEIVADKGASVYTVEVTTADGDVPDDDGGVAPPE